MTTNDNPIITEHAILMSGGSMQVFNNDTENEDTYPLADRIRFRQRFGGKVYRRRVIVVDEWEELTPD